MEEYAKAELGNALRTGLQAVLNAIQPIAAALPNAAVPLQQIQDLIGDQDVYEQEIGQFTFEIPAMTLQEHIANLGTITPQKDVHYRERHSVLYRNSNADSYPHRDPDTAAFRARRNLLAQNPQATAEEIEAAEDTAREEQEEANNRAALEAPEWELLQRDSNNDVRGEDALLVFTDTSHKTVDWYSVIRNLKQFGEPLGYTLDHYKHALDRFVGFFAPGLKAVTDALEAVPLAQFLMHTSIPQSKFERLTSQMASLSRQPYGNLKTVLAQLQGAAQAYYHDRPLEERNSSINRLMIQGLVSFTAGPTNKHLLDQIRLSQTQGKILQWQTLLEAVTNSERVHGLPSTTLQFQSTLRSSLDLYHSTFTPVEIGISNTPVPVEYPLDPNYDFYHAPVYQYQAPVPQPDVRPAVQRVRPVNVPVLNNPVHQPVHIPAAPAPAVPPPVAPQVPAVIPPVPPPPPPPLPHLQGNPGNPGNPAVHYPHPPAVQQPQQQPVPVLPERHDPNTPPPPRPPRARSASPRRTSRERRPAMRYDAQAGAYLYNMESYQNNRPYSPNRQGYSDNRGRNNSRDRRPSPFGQYRQQSRDRYNNNNNYNQRNDRPRSFDRNRQFSPSRQGSSYQRRPSPFNNQSQRPYSPGRNQQRPYYNSQDRQQNRSPGRGNNGYRSNSQNNQRNYSRNGRQTSRDRPPYNNNERRRSTSPFRQNSMSYNSNNRPSRSDQNQRPRSSSRDRFIRQNGSIDRDRYPGFKPGVNTAPDYAPWASMYCFKCLSKSHHEYACPKFYRYAPSVCKKCNKGYHFESDCSARERNRSGSNPRSQTVFQQSPSPRSK